MSGRHSNDFEETHKQLKNPNPIANGLTWLRHREDSQAGLIDQMLLQGVYSLEDIATELNRKFKPQRPLAARLRRVRDHIEHLQNEDSRGNSSGVIPHKLRLKEVGGKWRFDV